MNKITDKLLQKKNLWHVGIIAAFLVISSVYYYPSFQGYSVDQGDVTNWVGMSQEIKDYRESGEQVQWTNSMFSGMPALQISMQYQGREIPMFLRSALTLWLPRPVSILFLYLVSFYILALTLRAKPMVGAIAALAFGFSTSQIIIIEAGHLTKAFAIGYAPLVIAGMIYAYRRKNWIMGVALSALFMTFELMSNHVQITYYIAFILIAVGIVELIRYIKNEAGISVFIKRSIGLLLAYGVAILVNFGNIFGTSDYAQYTTRGGTNLTINAKGEENKEVVTGGGLDREYITAWSYGKGETFTFLVPNFKGGESMRIGQNEANDKKIREVPAQYKNFVKQNSQYWGDQPFTSGPVYLGIIVVFLAILSLVYSKDELRWPLLIVTVLTVALSWGKNFMPLTDFFLDFVPGYNKFRAVTIILSVAQICVPILGLLFLRRLFKEREDIKNDIKPFYIVSAAFGFILLAFLAVPGVFQDFISTAEKEQLDSIADPNQYDAYAVAFEELKNVRISIFRSDVMRSFAFLGLGFVALLLFIRGAYNKYVAGSILAVLILFDLGMVDRRYLGVEKTSLGFEQWKESWKKEYPYSAGAGDKQILTLEMQKNPDLSYKIDSALTVLNKEFHPKESVAKKNRMKDWLKFRVLNRNTHFRVFDLSNPFNSSYASYFHKSIGGYHGAKLSRYQDLIDFHISKQNPAVLDMLNMRYQIASQPGSGGQMTSQFVGENPSALGNAWMTKSIEVVENQDQEILALESSSAVELDPVSNKFKVIVNGKSISEKVSLNSSDKVALIVPQMMPDSTVAMDTLDIGIPFKEAQQMDFALIPGQEPGSLNWTYDQVLDSTYADKKIIVVSKQPRVGWDPEKTTVVNKEFTSQLSQEEYTAKGEVELTSYHPDKLTYSFSSPEKQLVVFSEIYYPKGWEATIDGKKTDIIRVNYALRAVEVPAGDHKITMKYENANFQKSTIYAYVGSFSIIILLIAGLYFESRIPKEVKEEESEDDEVDEK